MTPSPAAVDDCLYYASREELPGEAQQRLETLAYRWGETYDAYLVNEARGTWLPRWEGVVGFTRRGRCVLVVGGLLAPADRQSELLEKFLQFAKSRRWNVSFYNIGRSQTAAFKEAGCQVTKMGEEPIIDLERTEWRGKKYEWVRRQENYCKRQGVEFYEVRPDDPHYEQQIAPQLERVSQEHLANTVHGREMQFFVGSFNPHRLGSRRLFVAYHQEQIVALIVCNPCVAGEMWAVEIYRKLPDAPRGVIPYAIMQTLRTLKDEGVKYASLSLIPLLRCDPDLHKGSGIFYFVAGFWWNRMNWLFDMRGIYHFKSRFRPDYREMFLAAHPRVTIRSMLALAMTWEIFKVNPLRLLWRRGKGSRQRSTLATPAWRPERVVRDVKRKDSPGPETAGKEPPAGPHRPAKGAAAKGADSDKSAQAGSQ